MIIRVLEILTLGISYAAVPGASGNPERRDIKHHPLFTAWHGHIIEPRILPDIREYPSGKEIDKQSKQKILESIVGFAERVGTIAVPRSMGSGHDKPAALT